MTTSRMTIVAGAMFYLAVTPVWAAPPVNAAAEAKVVAEATGGRFKAAKGSYFEAECGQKTDYDAEVVDLNDDGQPEVFTQVHGTCMGGMTGVFLNLYIKDKRGNWKPQFGFPGMYSVLATKNKGFPDIEIGGPGFCFPVWRWNGREYALHRNQYEGKPCRRN